VRGFQAEAGQEDVRVAIGHVVAIAVGVEEEIRSLKNEDASVAERERTAEVQSGDKVVSRAIGFDDRESIGPLGTLWRRIRDAIVNRPRVAIDLHPLEAGRVGVLQVLHHPKSSAVIEFDRNRLADGGFTGHESYVEAI